VVQGQLEPWRSVTLTARVAATVEALPPALGDSVSQGDTLIRLSAESRREQLEQARSELERAEADLSGASRLRGENLASQSEYLARRRMLPLPGPKSGPHDSPSRTPALRRRSMACSIGAPVELGDEVQPGDPLVELVQTDRLKATGRGFPSSRRASRERPAGSGCASGWAPAQGTLTFIASAAHPETRSFRIEAQLDNPERLRVAGSTATLRIGLDEVLATRLRPPT